MSSEKSLKKSLNIVTGIQQHQGNMFIIFYGENLAFIYSYITSIFYKIDGKGCFLNKKNQTCHSWDIYAGFLACLR